MAPRRKPVPAAVPAGPFHNDTDAMLADVIGEATGEAKALDTRLEAAKAEFVRRGLVNVEGEAFFVLKEVGSRAYFKSRAVRAEMGEAWYQARSGTSAVTSFRVAPKPAVAVKAA